MFSPSNHHVKLFRSSSKRKSTSNAKINKTGGGFNPFEQYKYKSNWNLSQIGMKNKEKWNPQPNLTDIFNFWVNPNYDLVDSFKQRLGVYTFNLVTPSKANQHQDFLYFYDSREVYNHDESLQKITRASNGDFVYIPRTQLTSIFQGQPSKTRPFSIKTRVTWVLRQGSLGS